MLLNLLEDDIKVIIKKKEKEKKSKKGIDSIKNKTIKGKDKKHKENKKTQNKKAKSKNTKKKNRKEGINKNHINVKNSKDMSKSLSKLVTNINEENLYTKYIPDDNKNQKLITYKDYEMNSFSYKNAIKYDKRTLCQYYISLIRTKQIIIFSFCPMSDYNSRIVKIDLFFLSFCIYSFINCLFFDEKTIHKIYEDEGIYNFIYLVPYILYSFIISHTLFTIIKYFSLSERNICEIKNETEIENVSDKAEKVKRCIKIKYNYLYYINISFFEYINKNKTNNNIFILPDE